MALSNRDRVGKALEVLNSGLKPFVEREMEAVHAKDWMAEARQSGFRDDQNWDTQALLSVMWNQWNMVFSKTLGRTERSIVSELRDVRNKWAHQEAFTTDDAYRALDSMTRLLSAVSAPESEIIEKQKQEILRLRFEDQTKKETRRTVVAPIEGKPTGGLRPWRKLYASS